MEEERELVRRLQQGDPAACDAVIRAHHRFLVAMAVPLVRQGLADDVAQETWLKSFAAIKGFEGRSRLRTWLARIALNEAHALLRRYKREVSLEGWGADSGSPILGLRTRMDVFMHLGMCPRCRRYIKQLRLTSQVLQQLPPVSAPVDTEAILDKVRRHTE